MMKINRKNFWRWFLIVYLLIFSPIIWIQWIWKGAEDGRERWIVSSAINLLFGIVLGFMLLFRKRISLFLAKLYFFVNALVSFRILLFGSISIYKIFSAVINFAWFCHVSLSASFNSAYRFFSKANGSKKIKLLVLTAIVTGSFPSADAMTIENLPQQSDYGERLRQANRQAERNDQIYGGASISHPTAQIYAQGNFINRMNGYFGPQGVNVFNDRELNRSVQYDQSQRDLRIKNLTQNLENQIQKIGDRQNDILQKAIDPTTKEFATLDKGTLHQVSRQLNSLAKETEKLEASMPQTFNRPYRENISVPYVERPELIQRAETANRVGDFYLHGGTNFSGITGIKRSLYSSAGEFSDAARQIERNEDKMRDQMIGNIAMGGVALVAAIATAGTAAPLAAQIATGTGIAGGTASLGNTIRNHVILNEKGYEGLRSASEQKSQLGVQSFGYLTTAVSIGASLSQFTKTISNAHSIVDGVHRDGFAALNSGEKIYAGYQYVNAAVSLGDAAGLNTAALGDEGNIILKSAMAGSNLAFTASGTATSFRTKTSDSLKMMASSHEPEIRSLAKIPSSEHPLTTAHSIASDALTIAESFPNARKFIQENSIGISGTLELLKMLERMDETRFQKEKNDQFNLRSDQLLNRFNHSIVKETLDPDGLAEKRFGNEALSEMGESLFLGKSQSKSDFSSQLVEDFRSSVFSAMVSERNQKTPALELSSMRFDPFKSYASDTGRTSISMMNTAPIDPKEVSGRTMLALYSLPENRQAESEREKLLLDFTQSRSNDFRIVQISGDDSRTLNSVHRLISKFSLEPSAISQLYPELSVSENSYKKMADQRGIVNVSFNREPQISYIFEPGKGWREAKP